MLRQSMRPENVPVNLPPPKLRLALGMTCSGVNSLAVDPHSGTLAYPASGVIILFDIVKNRQVQYVTCARTSVTCVSFSPDGRLLLIGESGRLPALRVWGVAQRRELAAFRDHECGLVCARFSHAMDLIVSVGTKHDQQICVRSWPRQHFLATNRFWEGVSSMAACPSSATFVTCGEKHIKFWYPVAGEKSPVTSTLMGRPATLGSLKSQSFVACAWGSGRSEGMVFAVTTAGYICKISADSRTVKKTRFLKDAHMTSVQVTGSHLYVGTVKGYITSLDVDTLETTMSLTSPLDICFAEQAWRGGEVARVVDEREARVFLSLDPAHKRLVAALTNGSLCVWDVRDHTDVTKTHYSVSHSKAITCLESMVPAAHKAPDSAAASTDGETLVTVAHDSTVRLWQMAMGRSVCCESSKTIYTDLNRKQDDELEDDDVREERRVITTAKVSPESDIIVTGDSRGLLTVYDALSLANTDVLQQHSRHVTAIAFFSHDKPRVRLMLTAAKDRLINVFAAQGKLRLLKTLHLHSGCVTSLGVCFNDDKLILVSSSHDRSVVLSTSPWRETPQFKPTICQTGKSPVVDVVIHQAEHQVVVARHTGEVSVFDISKLHAGQKKLTHFTRFRACWGENVHLEKITLDPSGSLLLAAMSDHVISVLSHPMGVQLSTVHGHSRPVTGLRFSNSMRYIVSTAADGCMFVWALPSKVMSTSVKIKKAHRHKHRKNMPSQTNSMEADVKDGQGDNRVRTRNRSKSWTKISKVKLNQKENQTKLSEFITTTAGRVQEPEIMDECHAENALVTFKEETQIPERKPFSDSTNSHVSNSHITDILKDSLENQRHNVGRDQRSESEVLVDGTLEKKINTMGRGFIDDTHENQENNHDRALVDDSLKVQTNSVGKELIYATLERERNDTGKGFINNTPENQRNNIGRGLLEDAPENHRTNSGSVCIEGLADLKTHQKCQHFVNNLEDPVGAATDESVSLSSSVSLEFSSLQPPSPNDWEDWTQSFTRLYPSAEQDGTSRYTTNPSPDVAPAAAPSPGRMSSPMNSPYRAMARESRETFASSMSEGPSTLEENLTPVNNVQSNTKDIRQNRENLIQQSTMNPYAKEWSGDISKTSKSALNPYAKEWTGVSTQKTDPQPQSLTSQLTFSNWLSPEPTWHAQDNVYEPQTNSYSARGRDIIPHRRRRDVISRGRLLQAYMAPPPNDSHNLVPPTNTAGALVKDLGAGGQTDTYTPLICDGNDQTSTPFNPEAHQDSEQSKEAEEPTSFSCRVQYFESKWQENTPRPPAKSGYRERSASRNTRNSYEAMNDNMDKFHESKNTDGSVLEQQNDETKVIKTSLDTDLKQNIGMQVRGEKQEFYKMSNTECDTSMNCDTSRVPDNSTNVPMVEEGQGEGKGSLIVGKKSDCSPSKTETESSISIITTGSATQDVEFEQRPTLD